MDAKSSAEAETLVRRSFPSDYPPSLARRPFYLSFLSLRPRVSGTQCTVSAAKSVKTTDSVPRLATMYAVRFTRLISWPQ